MGTAQASAMVEEPRASIGPSRAEALLASLRQRHGGVTLALADRVPPPGGEPGVTLLPEIVRDALVIPGAVVELCERPGAGAFSLALLGMIEAYARRKRHTQRPPWLCALDPERALCAPGVAALGAPLARFMVVAPPREALARLSVRVAKSGVFAALLIDATGIDRLDRWQTILRKLTLAAEEAKAVIYLVTDERSQGRETLTPAVRADVGPVRDGFGLRLHRHKQGILGSFFIPRPPSLIERVYAEAEP